MSLDYKGILQSPESGTDSGTGEPFSFVLHFKTDELDTYVRGMARISIPFPTSPHENQLVLALAYACIREQNGPFNLPFLKPQVVASEDGNSN